MGTRAGAGGWGLYPGRRARPRLASLAEPPSPAHGPARALRPGSPLLPPLPRLPPSPAWLRGILLARILLALPSSPPTSKPRLPPRRSACAHSACSPVFPAYLQAPPTSKAFCLPVFCLLSRLPRLPPSALSASRDRTGGLIRNPGTPTHTPFRWAQAVRALGGHGVARTQPPRPRGRGPTGPRLGKPVIGASMAVRFSGPRDAVSGPPCGIRTERNSVSLRSVRASARPGGTRSPRPAAG